MSEADIEHAYSAEMRIKAIGLLCEVAEPAFMFIAFLVQKLLMLLDSPHRVLQKEDMNLLTELELVANASQCMKKLHCEVTELWNKADDVYTVTPAPSKSRRTMKDMEQFMVLETRGQKRNDKTELQRLFYSAID